MKLDFSTPITSSDGSALKDERDKEVPLQKCPLLCEVLAEEIISKSPSGNPMKMIPWTGILRKQAEAARASKPIDPLDLDEFDSKLLESLIIENKTVFMYIKYAILRVIEKARA